MSNETANVLVTCLSNQMTALRHITTLHYDVVFAQRNGHYFIKGTNYSLEFFEFLIPVTISGALLVFTLTGNTNLSLFLITDS